MRLWALHYQPYVTFDGTEYVRFAESLRAGHAFQSVFPPGYPLLVAVARLFVTDRTGAAVAVSMFFGTLLPISVWLLARRAVGDRWALLAALLVALHPELARFSAVTMSESACMTALYFGVALVALGRSFGSGLALAAAYAIRPEALVTAATLAATAVPGAARDRARRNVLLAGLLGFVLIAMPCWIYFHHTLGAWTLTPKISALHAAPVDWRSVESHAIAEPESAQSFDLLTRLRAHGPEVIREAPANALVQAGALLMVWPWPLLLLSIWGLALRRGLEGFALVYLLGLPLLGLTGQSRFALAAIPALAILAIIPLTRPSRGGLAVPAVLLSLGLVWCAWANSETFVTPFDGSLVTEKRAGEWLALTARPGEIVMDRKPFVAYYAGLNHRTLPDDPYETIIDWAVREHFQYLVISEWLARKMRPQLLPLLEDPAFRARERRLELIYVGADPRGSSLGIFRVLQPGEDKTGRAPVMQLNGYPGAGSRGP